MLWQKNAENNYVNFCREEIHKRTFEIANELLGIQITPTKSDHFSVQYRNLGNTFFFTEQWYVAMKLFNMSLCFAENGSKQMSLAYGNRSACFLHLKMYEKCLADIQLAIEAGYPQPLMPKLEARRADCLLQIQSLGQSAVDEPELSFGADDNLTGMANVLQIQRNAEFGRHITAKSDVGVGKVILMERAFIQSASDKYKRCDTCWKNNQNLIPCTKCTSALFCPGVCGQSRNHEIQCGMRVVDDDAVDDLHAQLIRSILIAIHEFSSTDDLMNFVEAAIASDPSEIPTSLADTKSKYRAFLKLAFDRQTIEMRSFPTQVLFVYKTLMKHRAIKQQFPSKKYRRFLMHLIGQHVCTIQSNTGGLMSNDKSPFNISRVMCENLSILVNYINHSCAPNVAIMSIDERNVCITLRPIKKGDQLFVSYFRNDRLEQDTIKRRTYLRDMSNFHCKCERCVPLTMVQKELDEMKLDACYQYLWKNINQKLDSEATMEKCIDFLNRYGRMPWTTELDFVVSIYERALKGKFEK